MDLNLTLNLIVMWFWTSNHFCFALICKLGLVKHFFFSIPPPLFKRCYMPFWLLLLLPFLCSMKLHWASVRSPTVLSCYWTVICYFLYQDHYPWPQPSAALSQHRCHFPWEIVQQLFLLLCSLDTLVKQCSYIIYLEFPNPHTLHPSL